MPNGNTRRAKVNELPVDIESSRKKARKLPVHSYEIFLKHTNFQEGRLSPDVSNIFTRECFEEWLSTRPTAQVKLPEQSFQRVLYAHIRGADKRRPFPEPIERELLKVLRDTENNPWTEMFKDQARTFGKRGFRRNGFHECLKRIRHQADIHSPAQSEALSLNNSSLTTFNNFDLNQSSCAVVPLQNGFKIPRSIQNNIGHWEIFQHCARKFTPVKEQEGTVLAARSRGLDIISPATYFYLNQLVDPNDFRFSWDFLIPSIDQQHFRKDRPVAVLQHNFTGVITQADANSLKIFRGSLIDKHFCELFASLVSVCYSFIGHAETLYRDRTIWRRDVMQRCDGTRMVCLGRTLKRELDTIVYIQDQSEFYPASMVDNVCFL